MYSIYGKTLAIALAALWVVFTPPQPVPLTTTADDHTLSHPPAAHVVLWSQSEEPASVELRVPEALVNALPTEERSSETIDLRVPGTAGASVWCRADIRAREEPSPVG